MPNPRSQENRFGPLADDGNTTSSQHPAHDELAEQQQHTDVMDTAQDNPVQTQSAIPPITDNTDPLNRQENADSDEDMDAPFEGSGLDRIDVVPSSTDAADASMNMAEVKQATNDIFITPEEAQTVTAENVQAFLKRKFEQREQDSAQKKLRTEADLPTHVTVSENPEVQHFEKPKEQLPQELVDFCEVQNPNTTFCRVMAFSKASQIKKTSPVGALFSKPEGITIQLHVDAGRYGTPEFKLVFKMAADKGIKTFSASWRPGVKRQDKFMMEKFQWTKMMDLTRGSLPHLEEVYSDAGEGDANRIARIVATAFICNYTKVTNVDQKEFKKLPRDAQTVLNRIFCNKQPFTVVVWFIATPNPETANTQWLQFLQRAVNDRLPPMWQYRDKSGVFGFDLQRTLPISKVGNGMYNVYAKKGGVEDKSKIINYHCFPRHTQFESPTEVAATLVVPIVRGVQYMMSQAKGLELEPHRFITVRGPPTKSTFKDVKDVKFLENLCYVYVRFSKTKSGLVPIPPAVDTRIKFELDNSLRQGKPHVPGQDKDHVFFGNVLADEQGCSTSCTQFCMLVTAKKGIYPSQPLSSPMNLVDSQMRLAHLSTKVDTTAAKRELNGAWKFADFGFETENLAPIRRAFLDDPTTLPGTETDLMTTSKDHFQSWLSRVKESASDNPSQVAVVEALEHIKDKLLAVIGPPGAGKTKALADTVVACLLQRRKCLVVGPANKSVDQAANYIFRRLPEENRSKIKMIRHEVSSVELRAMVTVQNYQDLSNRPLTEVTSTREPLSEVVINSLNEAVARTVRDHHDNVNLLNKCWKDQRDLLKGLEMYIRKSARRSSNVPAIMTSGYHLCLLRHKDLLDAKTERAKIVELLKQEPFDDSALAQLAAAGVEAGSEAWAAAISPALTDEEISGLEKEGRLKSAEARDKSHDYFVALDNYIAKQGQVYGKDREKFIALWSKMMVRVFSDMDLVLTTVNNAGTEVLSLGFKPSCLICDEAGQVTLSALAIILTAFTGWLLLALFGDPNQLLPYDKAGLLNEFREFSRLSSLGLLEDKDCRILRLTVQYRMAPAISQWVAKYFYKNQLSNHPLAILDNDWRRAARSVSKKYYNIQGPEGQGSEFWIVDVVHGKSHTSKNGISLVNYANSDAIALAIDRLLMESAEMATQDKIQPSDITLLTYYTGQKFLTITTLKAHAGVNQRSWQIDRVEKSTVDAFQGQESRIVLVDVVVAHYHSDGDELVQDADADVNDPNTFYAQLNLPRLSAHVRDAHRLCCGITRARDALLFFMQISVAMATAKASQTKGRAAISEFVHDAMSRNLIYVDQEHFDTSPEGERLRASWSAAQAQRARVKRKAERDAMIAKGLHRARKWQPLDPIKTERTVLVEPSEPSPTEAWEDPITNISIQFGDKTQRDQKTATKSKIAQKVAASKAQEAGKSTVVQLDAKESEQARAMVGKSSGVGGAAAATPKQTGDEKEKEDRMVD